MYIPGTMYIYMEILENYISIFAGEYPFNLDQCYVYYFDQNNNSANYTPPETTATPGSTSTISHQTEGKHRVNAFWISDIVVFLHIWIFNHL